MFEPGKPITLYMELLEEGVQVWRPVPAVMMSENTCLVKGEQLKADHADEIWRFEPGTFVRVERRAMGDASVEWVAVERVAH